MQTPTLTTSPAKPLPQAEQLPPAFTTLTTTSIYIIVAYSLLFLVGAIGNISVLGIISRRKLGKLLKWRITILILNLATADLIVICIVIPSEIIWRITIQWFGGNLLCKICQFGRAFGLYLSSMIIICISIDRFYAILFPLKMVNASRRVKWLLVIAWISAAVFAFPQVIVFSVQRHPKYPTFQQCVTYGFLTSEWHERVYNIFSLSVMYFIPLTVIFITYSMILCKIVKKSNKQHSNFHQHDRQASSSTSKKNFGFLASFRKKANAEQEQPNSKEIKPWNNETMKYSNTGHNRQSLSIRLNRHSFVHQTSSNNSTNGNSCTNEAAVLMMAKAKWKILRLTCLIVVIFLLCWTPYVVMLLWYIFDRESARKVPIGIQDSLFMMAVANSCVNPFVYGNYTKNSRQSNSSNNNNSNRNNRTTRKRHKSIINNKKKASQAGGSWRKKGKSNSCKSCSSQQHSNSHSIRLRNQNNCQASSLKLVKEPKCAKATEFKGSSPAVGLGVGAPSNSGTALQLSTVTRERPLMKMGSSTTSINCCCYSSKSIIVPETEPEKNCYEIGSNIYTQLVKKNKVFGRRRRCKSTACTAASSSCSYNLEAEKGHVENANDSCNSFEGDDCDCDSSSSCHQQQKPKLIFRHRQSSQSSPHSCNSNSCGKVFDMHPTEQHGVGACNHFPVTSVI